MQLQSALIVAEMWEVEPPEAVALQSVQPFCIDTLKFEQWLQWVMLPRLSVLLDQGLALPQSSAIHSYAEEYFHTKNQHVESILALLKAVDQVLSADC